MNLVVPTIFMFANGPVTVNASVGDVKLSAVAVIVPEPGATPVTTNPATEALVASLERRTGPIQLRVEVSLRVVVQTSVWVEATATENGFGVSAIETGVGLDPA